jgi:tRNA threonylcarbamoyladenosine biosynthesis protein TsaB
VLILGIDTSGRQGSVALLRSQGDPAAPLLTLELALLAGGQASEVLVPAIAALLARQGLEKSSLALIAVASGPGSFTGLRVAIATAKGLAEAFAIPVIPISVLQAIAHGVSHAPAAGSAALPHTSADAPAIPPQRLFAAIDAQRGEVFFGEYLFGEGVSGEGVSGEDQAAVAEPLCTVREDIAGFGDFAAAVSSANHSAHGSAVKVFTPDAALAARLQEAAIPAVLFARPSAEDIARIAYGKFLAGFRADVASLDAHYLRRSDAEIFSTPRSGSLPYLK